MRERIIYGNDGQGPVARYVDGELVFAREEQAPRFNAQRQHVMPDIQPYQSMIDGTWIKSRSQHREHLRQHGCEEVGNDSSLYRKPRPIEPPPGLKERLIENAHRILKRR